VDTVIMENGNTRISITAEEAFSICKAGKREACCVFLGMDKFGFTCMKNNSEPVKTLQHVIDGKIVNLSTHEYLEQRALSGRSNARSLGGKERGHEGCWWDL
jgi:hypothetical protein